MSPEDIKEMIDSLPLKKKTTTGEMLMLIFCIVFLFACGAYGWNTVKNYFDAAHSELIAAISKVESEGSAKTATVAATVAGNSQAIDGIHTYYVKNSDMQNWTHQLEKDNRLPVPLLVVPDFPYPVPPPPH